MILENFLRSLGLQKPLLAVKGDIFNTPADHIAFAVHWPTKNGYSNNNNGGFSSEVAKYGWDDIGSIIFKKGKPVTRKIKGKYFHALPVHSPEEGGWDETPFLIEECLNKLPVDSTEVISVVLIGGGNAGEKYKASIRNLEGMVNTYKTVVLYVYDDLMFNLLVGTGVIAQSIPEKSSFLGLPKVYKYRESLVGDLLKIPELVSVD